MRGVKTIIKEGDKLGNLILTGKSERRKRQLYVEVICECGVVFFSEYSTIKSNRCKSCGCKSSYYRSLKIVTHGLTIGGKMHPIYRAYHRMIQDCYNVNSESYCDYGGRGIVVCESWLNDVNIFVKWSLENGWCVGLTIDRIKNELGYSPDNCRWATYTIQNRNRTININITAFGETKCLQEWYYDERCSVTAKTIRDRMKRGIDAESAITKPSAAQPRTKPKQTCWVAKNKAA